MSDNEIETYTPPNIIKAKITPQLPANFDETMTAEALAMMKRIASPGGEYVRTDLKTFILPDGTQTDHLDVVIVDFSTHHKYYEGEFDENAIVPPVCVAIGQELNIMAPFPDSPKPQAQACRSCWANAWKSDRRGRGKACNNYRILALVSPDPDLQASGPLMLLKVTATAIRFWDAHVASVKALTGKTPMAVVTNITFDPALKYNSLRFRIGGINETPQAAHARLAIAREILLAKPEMAPADLEPKPGAKPNEKRDGK